MKHLILAARVLIVPFTVFTLYVVWDLGLVDFLAMIVSNLASLQVLIDLVIALTLVLFLMYEDAKRQERRFAPWLILTLLTGSIGPLLYLATGKTDE